MAGRIGAALAAAFLAVALAGGAVRAAETPVARTLVHQGDAGWLRLFLALDREVAFSLFTLTDPERIVIDLPALDWQVPQGPPPPGVRALRHGLFRPGEMRLVLELEGPMAVRRAEMRPGVEGAVLALDLVATDPASFAARAGWPDNARWQPARLPAPPEPGTIVVAIDPGHGGIDPGAVLDGIVEKEIALDVALLLAERIAAIPGLAPFLTRSDDRFVPLRGRLQLARAAGAHLMVSLHADSLASGTADGASIYTLSRAGTDSAADAFAERENRADILAGADLGGAEDDVTRLVIELARRASLAESIRLADALVGALGSDLDLLETRPHRHGNFFVLKAPDLPSVLVELGFLNSEADRARLTDPAWREAMAAGLARGIRRWVETADPAFLRPRGGDGG